MTFKRTIVVSVTLFDAKQLAYALGISNDAVLVSVRSNNFRGMVADKIIIDERCWPLSQRHRQELWPCLLSSERGSVFIIRELDMEFAWRNRK